MGNTAISIQNISKKYLVGKQKDGSLRGTLSGFFQSNKHTTEEFYALKDVSFDVMQGDVVGIIGKNGAGKSTLLKILSQITKPSSGRIELNGRVASLLEVGTGFHPELTGRENIYLNGTILGMTRKEVTQKFDEIVAFSGVEKFIDTPVKHYSSGMYVRLAFAVAAHLEPEILIIDEVLAVGDAEFQKKCLGKMKDVAQEGRTVLFVSHDLGAVKQLCTKGVLLEQGRVLCSGGVDECIKNYYDEQAIVFKERKTSFINIYDIKLTNAEQKIISHFSNKDDIFINFSIEYADEVRDSTIFISVKNDRNETIFSDETTIGTRIVYSIPSNFLIEGEYSIYLKIHKVLQQIYFEEDFVLAFKVIDESSRFKIYNTYNVNYGKVFSKGQWLS